MLVIPITHVQAIGVTWFQTSFRGLHASCDRMPKRLPESHTSSKQVLPWLFWYKKKKNCITTVLLFTKEKWLRYLKIYKICSVPWMSQGWTLDQTWGIIFGLQSWMWNFKFKPNFNLQSPEGFGKQIILFIIHRSSSIQLPKIPSKAFMAKWYLMARIQSWT